MTARPRAAALVVCCLSIFVVSTDTTILNVALPTITRDLATSAEQLQWALDAYTLTVASLLLAAGALADRLGRRRTLMLGLAVFVLGAALASASRTAEELIACRMIQGIGAAMIPPSSVSILSATYPEPAERVRAVGIWGAFTGIALAVGPTLGGLLVALSGWRSVFWITIPLASVALLLARLLLPESRPAMPRRFDPVGLLLVTTGVGTLVAALIEGPRWGVVASLAAVGVSVGAFVAFVRFELGRADPLIDPRLFLRARFTASIATAVITFACYGGTLLVATLYLQHQRNLTPPEAGALFVPMAVATAAGSFLSGRLAATRGARVPLLVAAATIAAGAWLLTVLGDDTPPALIAVGLAAIGLGFGTVNTPITDSAVGSAPPGGAGAAAAVASSSRQVGMAIGVAIAGSLVGRAPDARLAEAARPFWWIILGLEAAALTLALLVWRGPGRPPVEPPT